MTTPPNPREKDMLARAQLLQRSGKLREAAEIFGRLLLLRPDDARLMATLATLAYQLNDVSSCLELLDRSLSIDPNQGGALILQGLALRRMNRHEAALASFERGIGLERDNLAAHANRGITLMELDRFDEALEDFAAAIRLDPGNAYLHYNKARALHHLERFAEAVECYGQAIALSPGDPMFHNNRGLALSEGLGRHAEALAAFERAIALRPDYATAYNNRGYVLSQMRLFDQALSSFDIALRYQPDYAEAHFNRGQTLSKLRRFDEARTSFDRAIAVDPGYAKAYRSRGNALMEQKRFDEALQSLERARRIAPDLPGLGGERLYASLNLCAWHEVDGLIAETVQGVLDNNLPSGPFELLAITDSPEVQQRAAQLYAAKELPPVEEERLPAFNPRHARLRIGYFSADFHCHATMHLMAEFFECHDRSRFESIAFSYGPAVDDKWRRRAMVAFDRFIDVSGDGDRDIAALARRMEIDIAVDLKGYTADARPAIFCHRAAPIQVSWLGFPGTMGTKCIDYLLADRRLIDTGTESFYTEKIAYLPNSYQPNDSRQAVSAGAVSRADFGLPDDGFVFCSFNNNYKILPPIFSAWMDLLRNVSGSVLWLLVSNRAAAENLKIEAAKRQVDPARLVFAAYLEREDHLRRLRLADLFLDTFPYNAHTTASDALRMGLPVLTRAGQSFASRVGASLLAAVGLPELVTHSLEEYRAAALELARNPDVLSALRARLRDSLPTAPLFDTPRLARDVENAYLEMYQRHSGGERNGASAPGGS